MNQSFANETLKNFDCIFNNLIFHNLLINYPNLQNRVNAEAATRRCSVAV